MSSLPWFGRDNGSTLLVYAAAGILVGMGANRLNKFLDASVGKPYENPWAGVALKLVPVAFAVLMTQLLSATFARDWQGTVPGLFFVTFFFGMQSSLMEDVSRLAAL